MKNYMLVRMLSFLMSKLMLRRATSCVQEVNLEGSDRRNPFIVGFFLEGNTPPVSCFCLWLGIFEWGVQNVMTRLHRNAKT